MTRTKAKKARAKRPSLGVVMTRKQREWIARTSRLFDEVEAMDPNDPKLEIWATENWVKKGFMLGKAQGRKPNLPVGTPTLRS